MLDRLKAAFHTIGQNFGPYAVYCLLVIAGVAVYAAWNALLALLILAFLALVVLGRLAVAHDAAELAERENALIEEGRRAISDMQLARARELLNQPSFKQVMPPLDGTEL